MTFYEPEGGILKQEEKFEEHVFVNPQHHTLKGKGYYNASDSLVNQPFEMAKKKLVCPHRYEQDVVCSHFSGGNAGTKPVQSHKGRLPFCMALHGHFPAGMRLANLRLNLSRQLC